MKSLIYLLPICLFTTISFATADDEGSQKRVEEGVLSKKREAARVEEKRVEEKRVNDEAIRRQIEDEAIRRKLEDRRLEDRRLNR